jgi:hypothetical protein
MLLSVAAATPARAFATTNLMLRADHANVLYHAARDSATAATTTTFSASGKYYDLAN